MRLALVKGPWVLVAYVVTATVVGLATPTLWGYGAVLVCLMLVTFLANLRGFDEGVRYGIRESESNYKKREGLMGQSRVADRMEKAEWN